MNDIYNHYLIHVLFEGGKLWMLLAALPELKTIFKVTLTLNDCSSARNYHCDITAQFAKYFC